jgi:hypothetical protein
VLRNVATNFKILRVHFSDGGNDLVARAPLLPGRIGQVKRHLTVVRTSSSGGHTWTTGNAGAAVMIRAWCSRLN